MCISLRPMKTVRSLMVGNWKKYAWIVLMVIVYQFSSAQTATIKGTITSSEGDTLPYASIFSETSGQGTSSNENGFYSLKLKPGEHRIIAQYVGYENFSTTIVLRDNEVRTLNIELNAVSLELQEVVIKGERNPADQIIREVIERRNSFLESSGTFEANVYIKGLYRIINAPEKIFGQETGGIDSILQNQPTNIIYLSETKSILTKNGGKHKEKILASKTSGFRNLPSMNNAALIDLNFYQNHPELLGQIIKSPVANDAFQHYNYKLTGTYVDADNRLINKIRIIPKRPSDPLLAGYIEIVEDEWVIKSINASCSGDRLKIQFLDSLNIKQIFLPVKGQLAWPLLQTELYMGISAFGFEAVGGFTGVYDHYIFEPDSFKTQIDRVQLEYSNDALDKDTAFWLDERPIKLSDDEVKDYSHKDSIADVLQDPKRLDSLERERNRFNAIDLFAGYEYRKREQNLRFSVNSPLSSINFNPVQGVNSAVGIGFNKSWGKADSLLGLSAKASTQYGFSDEKWRYSAEIGFRKNEYNPFGLKLFGGQQLLQINNEEPISLEANEFSNLFFKYHFARFYESRKLALQLSKSFDSGFSFNNTWFWERRTNVVNTTQFSIFSKNIEYPENIPDHPAVIEDDGVLDAGRIFKWKGDIHYQAGITYMMFPNNRITIPSELPKFTLSYNWGLPVFSTTSDFFLLEAKIDFSKQMGIAGNSSWIISGGAFLWQDELSFFDYKHFRGNEFFIGDADYTEDFMLLPYYRYSTNLPFVQMHWTHDFESYLLNKVPFVRDLGFSLIMKGSYLHHADIGHYNELSIGIDKLGWGLFRLLRVDFTASFQNAAYKDWGVVVGSRINLNDLSGFIN